MAGPRQPGRSPALAVRIGLELGGRRFWGLDLSDIARGEKVENKHDRAL